MTKPTRRDLIVNTTLLPALAMALLCGANYLAQDSYVRVDLTEGQEFTLSAATRAIAASLDAPVQVEVFQSADLPPEFIPHVQRVRDILSEFEAVTAVPFAVNVTDPGADPEARQRAERLGVMAEVVAVRKKGKQQKQDTWLGLSFHHRDGEEVIPFVRNPASLEFDIARALRSMQSGGRKKVLGFTTGHGEPDIAGALAEPRSPLVPFAQAFAQDYELRGIDLKAEVPVPEDIDAIVVLGPREAMGERAMWIVDQHVMKGRGLALFPLPMVPDPQNLQIGPAPVDWSRLLGAWGLQIGAHPILDRETNGVIQLPVRRKTQLGVLQGRAPVNSPLVPVLTNLADDHPITERAESLVAPFALPVEPKNVPEGVAANVLALSAPGSVSGVEVRSLHPEAVETPAEGEVPGPFPALVALSGKLPSAWRSRSPPAQSPEAAAQAALAASGQEEEPAPEENLDESAEGARVVVGGSFEMALANPGLLVQTVDWLVGDEALLAIRPRATAPPVLEPIPDRTRHVLRAANVFGVPMVLGLWGALRARARRKGGA
jgi:ABC-type uncharacterized transport system involved in gliding motility auxiliary subunit